MPVGPDGWFDGGKAIKVEGGIKARSRRGRIGEEWWSRRFIDILESICDKGRLDRGRRYARAGQVLNLDLEPGRVAARVQGSRTEPYAVEVTIPVFDETDWARVEQALAHQAVFRAKLLAGEMPIQIVAVFDDLGLPLFPAELDMKCTCPDWGFPCKHLSAVLYLLAEAFDDDPFLVLAWRGRARDDLLGALRGPAVEATPADPLDVPDRPLAVDDFYRPGRSLARLKELTGGPAAPPELLLRVLDPPPVKVRHIPLVDLLRPAYRALAETDDQPS
ncbi:SWIM zinc finger family protein [Asanoa sp. WMMD1127]|uniref:SWIM zinc finger family protein n=1 Tax=Asanoa sp. WMMD1127 TaxID=3016107 RepID=UPI002415DC00|nr:SWIM zinc finger family protein [Asanoa sp. WMMD1127]MDG4821621.1 SWIM zinc finger family protein [Asanoa sp. WMMD1127]